MAKRCGGLSTIFPDGDMVKANHELSTAVTKAMIILGYFEMMDDDRPDESIWNHQERLDEHFELVKQRRDNPNHEIIDKREWEEADLEQNELADEWRKAHGM